MRNESQPGKALKMINEELSYSSGTFQYQFVTTQNFYLYRFVAEKVNVVEPWNTIILYQEKGSERIHEAKIQDLLEDLVLLEQFHPKDAMRLGAIAMGDTFLYENKEMENQYIGEN